MVTGTFPFPWLIAWAFFTGYMMNAYSEAVSGSTTVRQANTKSCAVTGFPSDQRAFFRR